MLGYKYAPKSEHTDITIRRPHRQRRHTQHALNRTTRPSELGDDLFGRERGEGLHASAK
jgi:hypothetical protein